MEPLRTKATAGEPMDADIHNVLRHHEQQLGTLTTEVGGIKSTLRDQGSVLSDIRGSLHELKGKQGPGIGNVLGLVALAGTIISMISGGIIILVTSYMSPVTTKLQLTADQHETFISKLETERDDDLKEFRRQRRTDLNDRLSAIEDKLAWAARTERKTR